MERDFWGIFHDGTIKTIQGSIPGSVVLSIEIAYLRKMFGGEGAGFDVYLEGCTKLEYSAYDEEPISDLPTIAAREPEILYVDETDPEVVLDCALGWLRLQYRSAEVRLDSGAPVTDQELERAAEKYWNDWSSRNGSSS